MMASPRTIQSRARRWPARPPAVEPCVAPRRQRGIGELPGAALQAQQRPCSDPTAQASPAAAPNPSRCCIDGDATVRGRPIIVPDDAALAETAQTSLSRTRSRTACSSSGRDAPARPARSRSVVPFTSHPEHRLQTPPRCIESTSALQQRLRRRHHRALAAAVAAVPPPPLDPADRSPPLAPPPPLPPRPPPPSPLRTRGQFGAAQPPDVHCG